LRQDEYPEGLFDLQPTPHQSTMTFPLRLDHAGLAGLNAEDLKFWRGDHMVAGHELPRPAAGGAVSMVVSGSDTGIAHAPLLERPLGRGCVVHCQMKLIEKAITEPAAGVILSNLLSYLSDYRATLRKTAVFGADDAFSDSLRKLGVRFDEFTAEHEDGDFSRYSLVICHGHVADSDRLAAALGAYVKRGGNLLVHRPAPATMDLVRRATDIDLVAKPFSGPVSKVAGTHLLQQALTHEDLYWTVKRPGLSWARQPRSSDMTDGVFGPQFQADEAKSYEIQDWKTRGTYVTVGASSVTFASAGAAVGQIAFPETGKYGIGVRARGTPCKGVFPIVEVMVDGKHFGSVQLEGDRWQEYGVFGHVEQGRHAVSVAFVNDASDPPREDRNLEVECVLVVRDRQADNTTYLTAPAALVTRRCGAGQVVFDSIRWDTEDNNGRKARRHACSLLTGLEADFTPRSAVTLECEQMIPKADMKHHHTDGSTAYMGSNGYIKTDIHVAESRRYEADLVASGDASEGICPLVEIHVDGKKLAEVQLTTEGWRSYPLTLDLPQGNRELAVWFVNDHYAPSGDRNLRLDKLVLYNESVP
jgi:hypothetical protein